MPGSTRATGFTGRPAFRSTGVSGKAHSKCYALSCEALLLAVF
jgi:hypothetical protein